MILLAGDIGGTMSRFQWLDTDCLQCSSPPCCYASTKFASFAVLLETLLREHNITQVDCACFGLPGPVADAEVSLTNLPWHISACDLEKTLHIEHVELVNDFQVAALGVDLLQPQDLLCLHEGNVDIDGNRLVIGAGTGLGVAPVYQLAGRFYPQSSEGGHMDFAPLNDEQEKLLHWLHQRWSHVSYEHLLSGEGLESLYQFYFQQRYGWRSAPMLIAAEVTTLAEKDDDVATAAMNTFVNIYGEFVGNVALLWPARAGIYIAGGISAKISRWMASAAFVDYFLDKGKMRAVVEKMPVYLVLDELMGLKGALLLTERLAGLTPKKREKE
ncbi:MAG: glucokinase [Thermodesulfobacteriota bacterium]|nr:glucokinase [Thermodesulfobacteriota bacterium]